MGHCRLGLSAHPDFTCGYGLIHTCTSSSLGAIGSSRLVQAISTAPRHPFTTSSQSAMNLQSRDHILWSITILEPRHVHSNNNIPPALTELASPSTAAAATGTSHNGSFVGRPAPSQSPLLMSSSPLLALPPTDHAAARHCWILVGQS